MLQQAHGRAAALPQQRGQESLRPVQRAGNGAARGLRQPLRQNIRRCSAPVQAEDGSSDLRPGQTGPVQQPPVGPLGLHGECQQQVLRADAGVP